MVASPFPARLHVLLAASAPVGVVLRRGPSRAVASLRWDRRTDEFTLGQWVRARVYERRADLSPDGRYLIYFAMDGRWKSATRGSWTAVSEAPYLKALVLLGKGDAWHGGGLFTDRRTYWLNDGYGHEPLVESSEVRRDSEYEPPGSYGGECLNVYYNRLQRDGWTLSDPTARGAMTVFERPLARGWVLRKRAFAGAPGVGHGCYWDEHDLVAPDGAVQPCPTWEWADRDGNDVVYAESGCLYRLRLERRGPAEPRRLHDFNQMTFTQVAAPY
jgi:hypothetical protein